MKSPEVVIGVRSNAQMRMTIGKAVYNYVAFFNFAWRGELAANLPELR